MRTSIITLIVVLLLISALTAQPAIDLLQLYDGGGTPGDSFADVYAATDGGFLVCGQSNYAPWVVKLDGEGDVQWDYSEAGTRLWAVIQADNGDAVSVGIIGDGMYGAIRLDAEVELVWRREYFRGRATAVIELKNNNFLICGRTAVQNARGCVVMINPNGEPIWQRQYGENGNESHFEAMRETDGGVVLVGLTHDEGTLGWILKINHEEEGDIIWSHLFEAVDHRRNLHFRSIVSTEFGFAVGGIHGIGSGCFALYYVNGDGELIENHLYENGAWFDCLNKLSDGGFILVGYKNFGRDDRIYPIALRTDSEGNILWSKDFAEIVNDQPEPDGVYRHNQLHGVIVQPGDVIVACGNMFNNQVRQNGEDGLLVRLESDQLSPIIFDWLPEDTVFTALPGDTTLFVVRARDQQGDNIGYNWIVGFENRGRDTTVTQLWEFVGDYIVQCFISDGENVSRINWHVKVADMYIDSYLPEILTHSVRRNSTIDFNVTTRATADDPIEYLWLLNDELIADDDSVSIRFERGQEHSVTAVASQGELSDSVTWQVMVNDLIVDYMPEQIDLSVPMDTTFEFEVFPFDENDDSLKFLWTVNGDSVWNRSWLLMNFDEDGMYSITAYVSDTTESDSLTWDVSVHPDGVYADAPRHPETTTLQTPSPNPFNSRTQIRYSLPFEAQIDLGLYDISGRRVVTLCSGVRAVGVWSATIDGSELSSGVYFVGMSVGEQRLLQKVVLVK